MRRLHKRSAAAATLAPLALAQRGGAQSISTPERFDIVMAGAGHNSPGSFTSRKVSDKLSPMVKRMPL